ASACQETSSYEPGSTCQNRGCKEGLVGKAERQISAQKGYGHLQEDHRSQADECSYAEEVVGVDEGAVGSEERVESIAQGLNVAVRRLVYSRPPFLPVLVHTVT